MRKRLGTGSVSRSMRYYTRIEDEKFRNKIREHSRKNMINRKRRINKRCIDCKILISPEANRCRECSIKNHRKNYLEELNNLQ